MAILVLLKRLTSFLTLSADTQAWRARQKRGAAVYPVEVDSTTFDLMERFGGLEADKVDDTHALMPPSLRSSTSPAAFAFNL